MLNCIAMAGPARVRRSDHSKLDRKPVQLALHFWNKNFSFWAVYVTLFDADYAIF